jgi:hypothetical protein
LNVKFIRSNIPEKEANSIRYYTRTKTGRPFDSEEFIKKMGRKLQREFMLKSPSRPRKGKQR